MVSGSILYLFYSSQFYVVETSVFHRILDSFFTAQGEVLHYPKYLFYALIVTFL